MNKINNCDNCKYYKWYYDYCEKWKCEVDDREVHSCFIERDKEDEQIKRKISKFS